MPIQLDFRLSKPCAAPSSALDLEAASESSLRYEAFNGDVVFKIGGFDLSACWGWVPVLDFAAALACAVGDLEQGSQEAVLDFTESEDEIRFSLDSNGSVEVRSTYTDGGAETTVEELRAASRDFAKRVLHDLCEKWPALKSNTDLARWYPSNS